MSTPAPQTPADAQRFTRGRLEVSTASGPAGVQLVAHDGGDEIARIDLGIRVDDRELGTGARITGVTSRTVRESYTAHLGKATGEHPYEHDEHTLTLRTDDVDWAVVLRLADDGVAFRYLLPETASVLGAESTRVTTAASARAWVLEYQTWYETPRFGSDLGELAPGDYGFPVLLRVSGDRHLLLTESDIDGRSSGAHARFDGSGFVIDTADETTEVEAGHHTPWRVLIVGSLAQIIPSQLVDELAPPASADAVLPRPGRGAWSWWSSQYSGAYLEVQKRFTDFAVEQGWEHVLVDCGWDAAWVPELVAYASTRGVQVHLWSSWSDLDGPEALKKLALWRSWGVAGIKVDFMESEARERYRWYDAIIAESARVGLTVNFHGSVIPRGWNRTYPHVVSYEAVRGAEYYVFYGNPLTASHNVILPFTRNVIGSMDYTPVAFSAPGRETTDGHELALGVVYESGITHFADDPDRYRERPDAAAMLAALPATWDEVRLLDGGPDSHVLLARRSGENWFVGALSSRGEASELTIDVAALVGGAGDVWVVGDAADGALAATTHTGVTEVTVPVAVRGGFAAIVVPAGASMPTARIRPELAAPRVETPVVTFDGTQAEIVANAGSIRCAPGWSADEVAAHRWIVRPDDTPTPGAIAVFSIEAPGHDGVPVVAHARVVVPFTTGEHRVSTLPFLAARNEVGPVERDLANGGGDPRDGEALTVLGTVHADGLGVSQSSEVDIALAASATRLIGALAIDDETPDAAATAIVRVDDTEVLRREVRGGSEPQLFEIDLGGASVFTLATEPLGDTEAHVDWLAVRIQAD